MNDCGRLQSTVSLVSHPVVATGISGIKVKSLLGRRASMQGPSHIS